MSATRIQSRRPNDRYLSLVRTFPLRPIHDRKTYDHAIRMYRSLWTERDAQSSDYKSVLVSLIQDYERHTGWCANTSKLTAADIVKHILDERDLSVNAFAKELGLAQSALSDMLNGKRGWSKSAIIAISNRFKLNPGLFLK